MTTPRRELSAATARSLAVAAQAARQHGVLSRAQLAACGVGPDSIARWARNGRLHIVHRGVYALGHVASSTESRAMAAVLACGPGAVLSHRSAALLWQLGITWRGPVEITAPARRRHPGLRIHRSRTLDAGATTTERGIPVTTVARTIVDLADVLGERQLARAVNEAQVTRHLDPAELAALLQQSPGRRAHVRLAPHLARTEPPTRSAFEDAFLAFAAGHGLPAPQTNRRVAGYEVDVLWRRRRLVVELDGRAFHSHARAFERDRERDANLLAAGYRVLRVTWQRLTREPEREAARLRALLVGDAPG